MIPRRDLPPPDPQPPTGLTREFRTASDDLDHHLQRLRSVLHTAHLTAHELDGPQSENAEAVVVLIDVAEEAVAAAQEAKDRAWRAQGGR
mgnify:CR=1 FL=1